MASRIQPSRASLPSHRFLGGKECRKGRAGANTAGDFADDDYAVTISVTDGVNIASTSFSWDVLPPMVFDDIGDHCPSRTRI